MWSGGWFNFNWLFCYCLTDTINQIYIKATNKTVISIRSLRAEHHEVLQPVLKWHIHKQNTATSPWYSLNREWNAKFRDNCPCLNGWNWSLHSLYTFGFCLQVSFDHTPKPQTETSHVRFIILEAQCLMQKFTGKNILLHGPLIPISFRGSRVPVSLPRFRTTLENELARAKGAPERYLSLLNQHNWILVQHFSPWQTSYYLYQLSSTSNLSVSQNAYETGAEIYMPQLWTVPFVCCRGGGKSLNNLQFIFHVGLVFLANSSSCWWGQ